jgi:uncharacterized membrane protein YhaH (DUF805 family)
MMHVLFSFKGPIGRAHYWVLVGIAVLIAAIAAAIGANNLNNSPMLWLSYAILLLSGLPILSATIRRLADLNLRGIYITVFLILIGCLQIAALLAARDYPTLAHVCATLSAISFIALGVIPGRRSPNTTSTL